MAPAADSDLYPVPFPEDVPKIKLERIDLTKVLDKDEETARRLFHICTHEGFFYLDLTTHPMGVRLIEQSHRLHNIGQSVFNNVSMADKRAFQPTDSTSYLDSGYKCTGVDEKGNPNRAEFVNIPQTGLFTQANRYQLPSWLAAHADLYRSFMSEGHLVSSGLLRLLEEQLQLPSGGLVDRHRFMDDSGDFLRVFRYPAPPDGQPLDVPPTPPHTDTVSVAMLFNWQGGLQITPVNCTAGQAQLLDSETEPENTWLFVEPRPGHAIINLGDPMVIFSNGLLKSGKHRVVTPPGDQSRFHRYSVLLTTRPSSATLMQPLPSPIIPSHKAADEEEVLTAKEWAFRKVRDILNRMERGNRLQ